jgi:hypothetical protein
VVPTIRIPGGVIHATPQKKSSIGRSAEARSASLDLAASLLLLEQLHQRSKNHRRQRCARLQGPEEAGEALLDNDLAGKLNVGPNRLAGTGRDLASRSRRASTAPAIDPVDQGGASLDVRAGTVWRSDPED